jgi:subtilase family serine protease
VIAKNDPRIIEGGGGNILSSQMFNDRASLPDPTSNQSLPLSFISQSSRQDIHNRFQGSHCSSNASVNSSQNDGGTNLRDAISNKKIMSYKLMSKVPGGGGGAPETQPI